VTLDGAAVERLGGLCLQVLLSASRTWAEDGRPFAIAPISDDFTEQWAALGGPGDLHGDLA
jgi:chemotaxis protein CheX